MKAVRSILRVLLVDGLVVSSLMALLLAFALSCAFLESMADRPIYELAMGATVVVLIARAGVRLRGLAASAGALGIPRHALRTRQAQLVVLALCTILPIALGARFGIDLRSLVVFLGIPAVVLAVIMYPVLLFPGLAIFYIDRLAGTLATWIFTPLGSAFVIAASLAAFANWLRQPQRLESQAAAMFINLADSEHETVHAGEIDAAHDEFERHLGDSLQPEPAGSVSARKFWLGMGYEIIASPKLNLVAFGLALATLVAAHYLKAARWDLAVYYLVSSIVAMSVFGRFTAYTESWSNTAGEQSLLFLAPGYPRGRAFKRTLLGSMWAGMELRALVWLAFSGAAVGLGWVKPAQLAIAAAGIGAVTLSCLGLLFTYFARARLRKTMLLPMAYLLCAFVGLATMLFSLQQGHPGGAWSGSSIVLAPFALAAWAFAVRPPQFPVRPFVNTGA